MAQLQQGPGSTPARLFLLGGFRLVVNGSPVTMPFHAQRVLAYLSLVQPAQRAHLRAGVAERLWDRVSVSRTRGSLRTALWQIRQTSMCLVRASRETIWLDDAVEVDVRRSVAQAGRLLVDGAGLQPPDIDISTLCGDLLPGWQEDWLLLERQRIRQLQIHALEALAHRLRRLGRHHEAIEAAFAAVAREPLRESAHTALIHVFLAEGNVAQARQQFERYEALLWSELAIRPSAEMTNWVVASEGNLRARSRKAELVRGDLLA